MVTPPSRLKTLAEELSQTQQMLLHKEEAVLELEKRIEESSETCEKKSEWVPEIPSERVRRKHVFLQKYLLHAGMDMAFSEMEVFMLK